MRVDKREPEERGSVDICLPSTKHAWQTVKGLTQRRLRGVGRGMDGAVRRSDPASKHDWKDSRAASLDQDLPDGRGAQGGVIGNIDGDVLSID